ncbi:hypothetical protein M407DRAFT_243717 [Tulasnella calospora MUT 4182]|uniref:Uncharacterized protein n=1 Tax=Tulasnella calospora MUT 4182 TaxID=1051891 RepID=A0A0C3KYR9_9AGAM|nr:hypothetical protein M407DRAFT_243717 [Tulasnella calospora MUT 4182]
MRVYWVLRTTADLFADGQTTTQVAHPKETGVHHKVPLKDTPHSKVTVVLQIRECVDVSFTCFLLGPRECIGSLTWGYFKFAGILS